MKITNIFIILLLLVCFGWHEGLAQNPVNWTSDQLLAPSELSATLKSNKDVPVIISIGPGGVVPNSKEMGMIREADNMNKFKEALSKLPKDKKIVVYCGCCPYENCPNVRPAIQLLKEMKFTNYKLLDLPHNIRVDWIQKGYPTTN